MAASGNSPNPPPPFFVPSSTNPSPPPASIPNKQPRIHFSPFLPGAPMSNPLGVSAARGSNESGTGTGSLADHMPELINPASYLYASPNAYASTSSSSPNHTYGLGPTLIVLDDPAKRYLQQTGTGGSGNSHLPFPPSTALQNLTNPQLQAQAPSQLQTQTQSSPIPSPTTSSTTPTSTSTPLNPIPPPLIPTPLPVSLPRLPPIPPLIIHQEQLYFDDGLGAPGKCPHDRKWGKISNEKGGEHMKERGKGLTDVEMDDFMVDLGDLVSKEYDAWIERCWVEAFHYTYTVSIPALIIGLIQSGATTSFLRKKIVHGGPHIDALLAQQFRHMLQDEHEKRMTDEDGSRRGVDLGNLLAGLVPVAPQGSIGAAGWGSMTGGGAAAGDGSASNRLAVNGGREVERQEQMPLSATSGRLLSQAHSGTGQMPISPNLSVGPPVVAPGHTAPTTLQYLQHLPDPARTGYGNGVCFHDLALLHGRYGDDHGPCMCDLTACRTCFHELLYFRGRRDPYGGAGRDPFMNAHPGRHGNGVIPGSAGGGDGGENGQTGPGNGGGPEPFIPPHTMTQLPTPGITPFVKRPSPLQIRHPDMGDMLLVEEHLRTRLHYMASPDVILRYGDEEEFIPMVENILKDDESVLEKLAENGGDGAGGAGGGKGSLGKKSGPKVIPGRKGKGGKILKGGMPPKLVLNGKKDETDGEGDGNSPTREDRSKRLNGCQLPGAWVEEEPGTRNTAVILTYRYLVKLLHATALYLSPFDFEDYADDCAVLTEIHPLAVYRRLVEPYVRRRAAVFAQNRSNDPDPEDMDTPKGLEHVDVRAWKHCMDQWEKEVAVREKEGGNAILKTQPARAVAFYTQAICLDSQNPVYYLNRAAAFNAIENYEDAEIDCSKALSLNKSHMKAWYRRAVARKGMGRLDEAEQDLLHLLNQAPNIAAASVELASIRKEIEEMKKREEVDDLD